MARHLRNPGNQFKVSLPLDDKGYLGRECPAPSCKRYFKVNPGTGRKGENLPLHCPYCGHKGRMDEFHTQSQIDYAVSVVGRSAQEAVVRDMKDMARDFNRRASGGLISLKMDVKSSPAPLRHYTELKLETDVECPKCSLQYSVYGVFAFCPDCREHNSLRILRKNLEVVDKMLDMAATADADVAGRLVQNALEDCVSAFDGFARELCRVHAEESSDTPKAEKVPFQNLEVAKEKLNGLFTLDLAAGVTHEEWKAAVRGFQKRHLVAHKMGVVDNEYVRKTRDVEAVVGHKVSVATDEVRELLRVIAKLARHLSAGFSNVH